MNRKTKVGGFDNSKNQNSTLSSSVVLFFFTHLLLSFLKRETLITPFDFFKTNITLSLSFLGLIYNKAS